MSCHLPWDFSLLSRARILLLLVLWSLSPFVQSCGTKNQLEDKGEKTDDEKIRIALDSGDLTTAKTLLEARIIELPEEYSRYALLGAVNASLAGLDLTSALKNASGGEAKSGLDAIDVFLPSTTTADQLALMQKAIDVITAIPSDKRQTTSTERYSTSAALQLGLYQAAYGVMFLRQFVTITPDNTYDPEKLRTMSAADAEVIIKKLQEAAQGSPMAEKVQETVDAINATEGADQREKLINYLEAQKQANGESALK